MDTQKIIAFDQFDKISQKMNGKKILVGGCFDVLHIGHVRFLEAAKKHGDILIVALESDEFIQKKKNKQSFHTQHERAEILAALTCIDIVVLLPFLENNTDYFAMVKKINPDYIAVTENDPQIENKRVQAKEVESEVVVVTPYIPKKTSSDLIKAINKLE